MRRRHRVSVEGPFVRGGVMFRICRALKRCWGEPYETGGAWAEARIREIVRNVDKTILFECVLERISDGDGDGIYRDSLTRADALYMRRCLGE